jgi:hypothetical protein
VRLPPRERAAPPRAAGGLLAGAAHAGRLVGRPAVWSALSVRSAWSGRWLRRCCWSRLVRWTAADV